MFIGWDLFLYFCHPSWSLYRKLLALDDAVGFWYGRLLALDDAVGFLVSALGLLEP